MGRIPTTVGLIRGEGLVARFGSVVIYLAGESPSTERILGAAETAATAADPGVAIAQRLAATVFSSGSTQPPSFGVVAPTAGGILVLLRGPVRAAVDGPEGARQLSGIRAMTWADEILRDPVRKLTIVADTDPGAPVPHTDLRSGVVAAGGFVILAPPTGITPQLRTTTAATPKPAPPETRPATPTADPTRRAPVPTASHTRFSSPSDSEPLRRQAATTPAAPPAEETQAVPAEEALPNLTKAVQREPTPAAAAETHLDAADQPPTAAYDAQAAAAEEEAAAKVKSASGQPEPETDKLGARPGALTTADGAVYPLDRPYVIGRDPMVDESVRRAAAAPIVIPRDRHVSRVHAHVFIDNGMILVRDASTPGGTFIAAPGAQDWIRVGQRPVELKPGWSLRVGDRILTYRPDQRRR